MGEPGGGYREPPVCLPPRSRPGEAEKATERGVGPMNEIMRDRSASIGFRVLYGVFLRSSREGVFLLLRVFASAVSWLVRVKLLHRSTVQVVPFFSMSEWHSAVCCRRVFGERLRKVEMCSFCFSMPLNAVLLLLSSDCRSFFFSYKHHGGGAFYIDHSTTALL